MNKIFGLFVLALAFLAPDLAHAAARFAVCTTTCTWDNTSTAMWSTSSGGATGASAPTSSDTVTFDAATCVGGTTCTITTFSGTISAQTITWGACTASTTGCIIDASVNNTNFTLAVSSGTMFSGTGTGTRKWLAGTGTYSFTRSSSGNLVSMTTTTNDQGSVFSGATWALAGTTGNGAAFITGGFSYGPVTLAANTSGGSVSFQAPGGGATLASLVITSPNHVTFQAGATTTITNGLTLTGSSSTSVVSVSGGADPSSVTTISLGAASTGTWVALRAITTTGAGALTATNCFNLTAVTLGSGGSCAAPAGGGGGGRIIGG